jgi:hypothetical protein
VIAKVLYAGNTFPVNTKLNVRLAGDCVLATFDIGVRADACSATDESFVLHHRYPVAAPVIPTDPFSVILSDGFTALEPVADDTSTTAAAALIVVKVTCVIADRLLSHTVTLTTLVEFADAAPAYTLSVVLFVGPTTCSPQLATMLGITSMQPHTNLSPAAMAEVPTWSSS